MKNVYIFGAGEQGRIIIPNLLSESKGLCPSGFFDDHQRGQEILGNLDDLEKIATLDDELYIGIGNNEIRSKVYARLKGKIKIPSLVHPFSYIAPNCLIGEGTIVSPGAIINPMCEVGRCCIINTGAKLDHETKLGDFVHMEPGSQTAGGVKIGDYSIIGFKSGIAEDKNVGDYCHIRAGTIVLEDIPSKTVVQGIPAKPYLK